MSESEENENYCFFGKPLEPYDEDVFPKKKPISIEDQIATDAHGRRRFHGAFTGGFSAGFFNTVGSLEGWTPSEFKSTRQDKAHSKAQKPEDFMDDEDIGEFGIAPQTVRATSDYATSKKRRRQVFSDGPIPGEPVLHSLLTSNETIGYLLLKNIGLNYKGNIPKSVCSSQHKVYGCEMPKSRDISWNDVGQYVIPYLYKEFLKMPKNNTFGLGYEGLDKSHTNLFKTSNLVIKEGNNKKVSITGQAFGVGAFEEDDEDIYVKDDMSKYDFELTSEKASKKDCLSKSIQTVFDDFVLAKSILPPKEVFLPPTIPHSFTGKHKVKRSRFEPLVFKTDITKRKGMNPEIRAKYLGEEINTPAIKLKNPNTYMMLNKSDQSMKTKATPDSKCEECTPRSTKKAFDLFSLNSSQLVFNRFVFASTPEDLSNIVEEVNHLETTHGTHEMRDAVKLKMFGQLTRITSDWQPSSLLSRRFNVPEPHFDELNAPRNKKRTKNLIFEYEKFRDASVDFKPGLSTKDLDKEPAKNEESNNCNVIQSKVEENNTIFKLNTEETTIIRKVTDIKEKIDELPKDITEKIHINKNIDLFKAVFLSSSESDGEDENNKLKKSTVEMKISMLSDTPLPKIKSVKEGVLSNMNFSIFKKSTDSSMEKTVNDIELKTTNSDSVQENNKSSYGPNLPSTLSSSTCTTSDASFTQYRDYNDFDEWVEKPQKDKKNKNDHKKKHKSKNSSYKKELKHNKER